MRVFVIFILCLLSSIGHAEDLVSDMRAYCADKWSADAEMQRYCNEQMDEAWGDVKVLAKHYGDNDEEFKILDRCWKQWYPQVDMISYCSNNQIEVYRSGHHKWRTRRIKSSSEITTDIQGHCKAKWASDPDMRQYCVSQMNQNMSNLLSMVDHYRESSEERQSIERCWDRWYPQFDMVEYCTEQMLSGDRPLH